MFQSAVWIQKQTSGLNWATGSVQLPYFLDNVCPVCYLGRATHRFYKPAPHCFSSSFISVNHLPAFSPQRLRCSNSQTHRQETNNALSNLLCMCASVPFHVWTHRGFLFFPPTAGHAAFSTSFFPPLNPEKVTHYNESVCSCRGAQMVQWSSSTASQALSGQIRVKKTLPIKIQNVCSAERASVNERGLSDAWCL